MIIIKQFLNLQKMENKILLITLFFISYSFAQSCTGTVNGHNYDFTSLAGAKDYEINTTGGANPYMVRLNVCKGIVGNMAPVCKTGASGCQWWDLPKPTHVATLGMFTTMSVSLLEGEAGSGYTLSFTGGVSVNQQPVQMEINLLCSQSAGVGYPTIYKSTNNDWQFNWQTSAGCGGGNSTPAGKTGLSVGGILLIVFFCVLVTYLAAGVAVNKFVRHQNGLELIPNVTFWTGFGGLIKDGGRFIMLKTCKRGSSGGYNQVA